MTAENLANLYHTDDPTKVVAVLCRPCGTVYQGAAMDYAARCCMKTCRGADCKNPQAPYSAWCTSCEADRRAKTEADQFAKAEKIPAKDYGGACVFCDGINGDSMGDGYFVSVDDVAEHCRDHGVPVPAYVWACAETHPGSDADQIVDDALSDAHENAHDHVSRADIDHLQGVLDWFWASMNITSYHADYTRAVMVPETLRGPRHEATPPVAATEGT